MLVTIIGNWGKRFCEDEIILRRIYPVGANKRLKFDEFLIFLFFFFGDFIHFFL